MKRETKTKKREMHLYSCPKAIYTALERIAKERRKSTGEDVKWSGVLREILDDFMKKIIF